jgi:hypothetical protein
MSRLFILLIAIVALITGCAPAIQTVTVTPTPIPITIIAKEPTPSTAKLTETEVIAVVKTHAIKTPDNDMEKAIGIGLQKEILTPNANMSYWQATYLNEGKWDVTFHLTKAVLHWTVFESNMRIIFVGKN